MKDNTLLFDYEFDDNSDPFEGFDEIEEAEDEIVVPAAPRQSAERAVAMTPEPDTRSPEEKIKDLLAKMPLRKGVLLGVIRFCKTPQPMSLIVEEVERLQASNRSVFTGATLCELLERNGALVRTTESGRPFENDEVSPKTVVIDGVEYLEAAEPPVVYWTATPEALEAEASDDPQGSLLQAVMQDGDCAPLYQQILQMCSADSGATTLSIAQAIDNQEIAQSHRYYSARFTERLELCGALEWSGAWHTTSLGKKALEEQLFSETSKDLPHKEADHE